MMPFLPGYHNVDHHCLLCLQATLAHLPAALPMKLSTAFSDRFLHCHAIKKLSSLIFPPLEAMLNSSETDAET